MAVTRAHGIHEPIECRMLLHRVVQVHVIEQDHRPAVAEFSRFLHGGIKPAHTLFAQRRPHTAQQMTLAATRDAPQIGGNG
jgi:hypothetical protein